VIDQELLSILACPACKAQVSLENEKIICRGCGLIYPIKEGVPIMLIEEAKKNESK